MGLAGDGVDDFGAAVAGVGGEDSGGPVEPAVAPGVVNLEAFGAVPDNGGMVVEGAGFKLLEAFEEGQ